MLDTRRKKRALEALRSLETQVNIVRHIPFIGVAGAISVDMFSRDYVSYQPDLSPLHVAQVAAGVGMLAAATYATWRVRRTGQSIILEDQFTSRKRLVTDGMYAECRNPVYVGQTLAVAGFTTLYPTTAVGICLAAYLALTEVCVRCEERTNLMQFGKRYRDYLQQVPRWPGPYTLGRMLMK